jgi:gluconolactonase
MKFLLSVLSAFLLTNTLSYCQEADLMKLIKAGAQLGKLADGFSFTEGPTPDASGTVFFTDQPNDRIMTWSEERGLETFMQPSGRSNGLAFDRKGNLWSCADEKNELLKISPGKVTTALVTEYQGKLLNGPNDLWIASDGGIYFTDPYYRRQWWKHNTMPQEKQCVYYLGSDMKTLVRVAEDLEQPNGIVGSPNGRQLYVADIRANKTWVYDIAPDGSLTNKRLFCELGSDGMTIDSKGNLYLTGRGVTVFDKNGVRLGNIAVPESWTANVCFGGKDLKSLFITASKGLYRIEMNVKGTTF